MCTKNLCGSIQIPGCSAYCKAKQIFNRSIRKTPAAIHYCGHAEDVELAVRDAAGRGQTVRVRSGGHNYEGFCIGNQTAVIDVSCLKHISINTASATIKIGSGITNRELYDYLSQYDIPFPSGTCPTVSAAGLTQGGGWGHSARKLGLDRFPLSMSVFPDHRILC